MNFEGTNKNISPTAHTPVSELRTSFAEARGWSASHPRLSRSLWIGGGFLVLVLAIWAIYPSPAARNRGFNNGPQPVGVATATLGDINVTLNALGTVTPLATASVHPQVSGVLLKLDFTEGQMVKAGQLLAEIDPRPYQAALDQAKGTLTKDQATLTGAQTDLKRYQALMAANAEAQQVVDDQAALVATDAGIVETDKANVETAQINLGYTRIVSPVDGLAGLHQTDIGNYVPAGTSSVIVVVTEMQPMSVVFSVTEDNIGAIMDRVHSGAILNVDALDRSDTAKIASGKLATIDNEVNITTGTVNLRALFDNSDGKLFPQEFVNVNLLVNTLHNQTLIPISAIQRGSDGAYVFVVGPDKTANERSVTLGVQDADMVAITNGLAPGDTVVTDGADRLRDGAEVSLPNARGQISAPSAAAGSGDAARAQRRARAAAAMAKACGADIKSYCGNDQPGTREARTCLADHMSNVSTACRTQLSRGPAGRAGGGGGFGGGFGGGAP